VRYASTHSLVLLEHEGGVVAPASLSALTAATQVGQKVTGIVVGGLEEVKTVLPAAKRFVAIAFLSHLCSLLVG
jgi:electron transfer flavoprotein alpha subunit